MTRYSSRSYIAAPRRPAFDAKASAEVRCHLARRKCLSRGGIGSIGSRRAKGANCRKHEATTITGASTGPEHALRVPIDARHQGRARRSASELKSFVASEH